MHDVQQSDVRVRRHTVSLPGDEVVHRHDEIDFLLHGDGKGIDLDRHGPFTRHRRCRRQRGRRFHMPGRRRRLGGRGTSGTSGIVHREYPIESRAPQAPPIKARTLNRVAMT